MLKFGISRKDQLTPDNLGSHHGMEFELRHLWGFFKSRKFISLDLYNSLDNLSQAESDKIQGRMLARFSLDNGSLKYTHSQRFNDFDQLALKSIKVNFPACPVRIHDIGASDGRTSCDLYDHLNKLYGEGLDFLASDYAPYLYVLKRGRSARRLILDGHDNILQIITPPFVFIVVRPESTKLYPLNRLIRYFATIFYAEPLVKAYKAGRPGIERTRLDLLSRKCREYVAERKNFRFESYDVLSGPTDRFDIIRAMNVLNYSYFPEAQLRKAVENIVLSLNEGGLFITGSNFERGTIVNGALYKKVRGRMENLETSGKGSQVDALITNASGPYV
jgi:hypothetical protein